MARNVYTVKQVNAYIKNMFTQDFMLNRIYVKGEVSNCKYHTSGHIYFSLKDESGTIACVMFAGQRGGLSFHMREGQQIIVLGSVNVYERTGSYQLYAQEIRLDGEGTLYEKYQMLKQELEEMGMFASEYKMPIPAYARRIGVVTAPTGAAIRDIMNISRRRNPFVQLILYPALVQGEGAKESIVKGIRMLDQDDIDVIIVGRGGGSIEDLWAFNEEEVARAIFYCRTPVISAVGHETDTTIADYVADLRAPTPSAAAELAVFHCSIPVISAVGHEIDQTLTDYAADLRAPTPSAAAELAVYDYWKTQEQVDVRRSQLQGYLRRKMEVSRLRIEKYETKLKYLHPEHKLQEDRQRLADTEEKLHMLLHRKVEQYRHRFAVYMEQMKGLSPLQKLNQGYAYIEDVDKKAVRSIEQVRCGDHLSAYVTDGSIQMIVESVKEERHG